MNKNDPLFWVSITDRLFKAFDGALRRHPLAMPVRCRRKEADHENHLRICSVLNDIEEINKPLALMLQRLIVRAHFCDTSGADRRALQQGGAWPHWRLSLCSPENDNVVSVEACDFDDLQRQRDSLLNENSAAGESVCAVIRWQYAAYHALYIYLHRRKLFIGRYRFSLLVGGLETLLRYPAMTEETEDIGPLAQMLLHEYSL